MAARRAAHRTRLHRGQSIHFGWADGTSRLHLTFVAKGETKAAVTLEHGRLADSDEIDERRGVLARAADRTQRPP